MKIIYAIKDTIIEELIELLLTDVYKIFVYYNLKILIVRYGLI